MNALSFEITATNHLLVELQINNYPCHFLIDTGASASCIERNLVETLSLSTSAFEHEMSSANATFDQPIITEEVELRGNDWNHHSALIAIDLSTVNGSLSQLGISYVSGIIGTDILSERESIIDFKQKVLFFT